jgi:hypothetical protein
MSRNDPPRWDDPNFWSARGCVAVGGCFMAVLGIAGAVYYAYEGYTEGLLMIIAILLAAPAPSSVSGSAPSRPLASVDDGQTSASCPGSGRCHLAHCGSPGVRFQPEASAAEDGGLAHFAPETRLGVHSRSHDAPKRFAFL